MLKGLSGSKVAILCPGDVEPAELEAAKKRLTEAGAQPVTIPGDLPPDDAPPADCAPIILMGTCSSADSQEVDPAAVQFVREFVASDKPVGAIGNGARLLIAADAVGGRKLTSSLELAGEVHQAGGEWVDQAVEVDESLAPSPPAAGPPGVPAPPAGGRRAARAVRRRPCRCSPTGSCASSARRSISGRQTSFRSRASRRAIRLQARSQ